MRVATACLQKQMGSANLALIMHLVDPEGPKTFEGAVKHNCGKQAME